MRKFIPFLERSNLISKIGGDFVFLFGDSGFNVFLKRSNLRRYPRLDALSGGDFSNMLPAMVHRLHQGT